VKESYLTADIIIYRLIKSEKNLQSVAQPDLTLAVVGFQKKISQVTVLEMQLRKRDLRFLSELI